MERDLEALYLADFPPGQKAMAASRQVIDYTIRFIIEHGCESLRDAGSGMSSLFFHHSLSGICEVRSCDDSSEWADVTRGMIQKILGIDVNVERWNMRIADVTFYDYGSIETRIFNFKKAAALTGRYMIIDDMHVSFYRDYVQQVCVGKELRFLPETIDEYGRYAALLVL